jgi:hypothetical protein
MALAVEVEALLALGTIHMAALAVVLNPFLAAVEEANRVVVMAKAVVLAGLRSLQLEEL